MIFGLKKLIVLILVLLQFVAPLVHAHSGNSGILEGFHQHGLETLNENSSNYFQDEKHQSGNHKFNHHHMIVSISHGIKHNNINLGHYSSLPPQQSFSIIKQPLFYYEIIFSPQHVLFINNFVISLQSPRAPPLYAFS
ncbi:MAG: hypothetical protein Q9M50_12395 [Methylococcales bacterium]|nr:hypothetical protein [Methylococcales bacterium]